MKIKIKKTLLRRNTRKIPSQGLNNTHTNIHDDVLEDCRKE